MLPEYRSRAEKLLGWTAETTSVVLGGKIGSFMAEIPDEPLVTLFPEDVHAIRDQARSIEGGWPELLERSRTGQPIPGVTEPRTP
jgi:hypothetical protein